MRVARQLTEKMSLRRSLSYAGISRNKWYHLQSPRNIPLKKTVSDKVQEIATQRPTYGTRRMAASVSRELNTRINRKQIQRIYQKLGWIVPRKTKNDIIKSSRTLFRPSAPNQLWQTDITYVWCGVDGWCYCFNVLDAFSRR